MPDFINVYGAGLAGCEAAFQIAKRGIKVRLFEMKPNSFSPAHSLDTFAELVCSNSLKAQSLENASGLLKEEMRILDSLIIKVADQVKVPAGGALAVDREKFSIMVTDIISSIKNIEIINHEAIEIPKDEITIIATGPLTSEILSQNISDFLGSKHLHFFDAAAPVIYADSIDMSKVFKADRYGKGTDDYINCPMNKEQYEIFLNELLNADLADVKDFEKNMVFEGCMPIEVMAKRGIDTMRFGPLKPVGLIEPNTGKEPYAVVQLRQENIEATIYNMVGFQTRLKWGEQKRIFSLIPGLEKAEFARYGVMHKNTFINSPELLDDTYNLKSNTNIFFAGQITGVEGYMESASSGMLAGINAARMYKNADKLRLPMFTAIGALSNHIANYKGKNFQPMNINYGIIENQGVKTRNKKEKYYQISMNSIEYIQNIILNKI